MCVKGGVVAFGERCGEKLVSVITAHPIRNQDFTFRILLEIISDV